MIINAKKLFIELNRGMFVPIVTVKFLSSIVESFAL